MKMSWVIGICMHLYVKSTCMWTLGRTLGKDEVIIRLSHMQQALNVGKTFTHELCPCNSLMQWFSTFSNLRHTENEYCQGTWDFWQLIRHTTPPVRTHIPIGYANKWLFPNSCDTLVAHQCDMAQQLKMTVTIFFLNGEVFSLNYPLWSLLKRSNWMCVFFLNAFDYACLSFLA